MLSPLPQKTGTRSKTGKRWIAAAEASHLLVLHYCWCFLLYLLLLWSGCWDGKWLKFLGALCEWMDGSELNFCVHVLACIYVCVRDYLNCGFSVVDELKILAASVVAAISSDQLVAHWFLTIFFFSVRVFIVHYFCRPHQQMVCPPSFAASVVISWTSFIGFVRTRWRWRGDWRSICQARSSWQRPITTRWVH